jgi:hypothetical protein
MALRSGRQPPAGLLWDASERRAGPHSGALRTMAAGDSLENDAGRGLHGVGVLLAALAEVVSAPAVDFAAELPAGAGVIGARLEVRPGAHVADRSGHPVEGGAPDVAAELPEGILAPAIDEAPLLDRAGVSASGAQLEPRPLDLQLMRRGRVGALAALARVVGAPAVNIAGRAERATPDATDAQPPATSTSRSRS